MRSPRSVASTFFLCSVLLPSLALAGCRSGTGDTDTSTRDTVPTIMEETESGAVRYYQGSSSSRAGSFGLDTAKASAQGLPPSSADGAQVTGSITITEEAERTEAQPGDKLWYRIVVTNNTNVEMVNLQVENSIPATKATVADPAGGAVSGETISWTIPQLGVNQVKVLGFQLQLKDTLKHGDTVLNIATLRGGRLPVSVTATSEVKIIKKLPQTGPSDFLAPVDDGSQYLSPLK